MRMKGEYSEYFLQVELTVKFALDINVLNNYTIVS